MFTWYTSLLFRFIFWMKKPPASGISSSKSKHSQDFGNGEKISANLKFFCASIRVHIGAMVILSAWWRWLLSPDVLSMRNVELQILMYISSVGFTEQWTITIPVSSTWLSSSFFISFAILTSGGSVVIIGCSSVSEVSDGKWNCIEQR